jgi:hypothetical protein
MRSVMAQVFLVLAIVALSIPALVYLFWFVHRFLESVCMGHAKRYCKNRGFDVRRIRCQPAFGPSGAKLESSLVQLDCFNNKGQRRLILLLVWPFGVRKVISVEKYDDDHLKQWPMDC